MIFNHNPNNQNQSSSQYNYPFYNLRQKIVTPQNGLFKLIKYDEDHIMFSAPESKCVAVINSKTLQPNSVIKIKCEDRPLAIDLVQIGQGKFIIVGQNKGGINVKAVDDINIKTDQSQLNQFDIKVKDEWRLKPKSTDQIFVNQIVHIKQNPNIIVNCYNNGSIAVWGLLSSKRLHTFYNVHEKYTYKLRFQTKNILVSCGNDGTVVRTDLQTQQCLSILNHPLPVWCAYPINQNQIASVGLTGRVLVWDIRSNRIVQACNNSGHQTSFITARNNDQMNLFYGDMNLLARWDRRKSKAQIFTQHTMGVSAESLLFDKNNLYICGRGRDLLHFSGSDNLQQFQTLFDRFKKQQSKTKILLFNTNLEDLVSSEQQQLLSDQQQLQQLDNDEDIGQEQNQQQIQIQIQNSLNNKNLSNMEDQSQFLLPKGKDKQQIKIQVDILNKLIGQQNIWLQKRQQSSQESQSQQQVQQKKSQILDKAQHNLRKEDIERQFSDIRKYKQQQNQ